MIQHSIKDDTSGDHYGVSSSTTFNVGVLVQLQDSGEQVRLKLSPDQAEHMAKLLLEHAHKVRDAVV